MHACINTCTHAHIYTYTHTYTDTNRHTHPNTHEHTHPDTHTMSSFIRISCTSFLSAFDDNSISCMGSSFHCSRSGAPLIISLVPSRGHRPVQICDYKGAEACCTIKYKATLATLPTNSLWPIVTRHG